MFRRKSLLALGVCLLASLPALAQVSTGEIEGTITDSSGAAIPNAKVTATNAATNTAARETTTSPEGSYSMTFLPPGTYSLAAESSGFRKTVQSGIELQTNQRARVDFQLQVGQITETVEVAARAPRQIQLALRVVF